MVFPVSPMLSNYPHCSKAEHEARSISVHLAAALRAGGAA